MRIILCAMVMAFATLPLRAQTAPEMAIRDIISQQLEALQRDDFETAFDFASPLIQQLFQTPERFGDMVSGGYPMVHRPDNYRFDALRDVAGGLWQSLIMYDSNGRGFLVEYQMIETEAGWRINGVQVSPLPDAQV